MKVCLLGVSHWHAPIHLDAVQSSGGEVTAIWDQDAGAGADFAATYGLRACNSPEQALAAKPDLAVVMGSPGDVPDVALKVIAADLPMILEKPAARAAGAAPLYAGQPGYRPEMDGDRDGVACE